MDWSMVESSPRGRPGRKENTDKAGGEAVICPCAECYIVSLSKSRNKILLSLFPQCGGQAFSTLLYFTTCVLVPDDRRSELVCRLRRDPDSLRVHPGRAADRQLAEKIVCGRGPEKLPAWRITSQAAKPMCMALRVSVASTAICGRFDAGCAAGRICGLCEAGTRTPLEVSTGIGDAVR